MSKWYTHLLTLSYPVQYAKRLSNIIAKLAAVMYTFVVWVISWAMWVYNTTQGLLVLSFYWYKGRSILLIFINIFILDLLQIDNMIMMGMAISKVPKIASLQCLYNMSKHKLVMKLIFFMQINIKVAYKLILILWAQKFPTRWYYHHWWAR